MPTQAERDSERDKYIGKYDRDERYHMSGARMDDALKDLKWAKRTFRCTTYLDIGCGRGEMLDHGEKLGLYHVQGTEIVPELCDGDRVEQMMVHELDSWPDGFFDCVSCLDVIEHLHPGDDEVLVRHMGRIAGKAIFLTANNLDSICKQTGEQMHINKRPYDEWHQLIKEWLPGWKVQRMSGKAYVSETWRAWR